jgi:hypothetical protein
MLLSFLEADIENARFSRAGQGCVFDEVFGYGQERPGKFRSVDLFPAANLDGKAEFTGAHKQALEQHNEALCLLKLDRVDDRLQTTHIRVRERNIVKFG